MPAACCQILLSYHLFRELLAVHVADEYSQSDYQSDGFWLCAWLTAVHALLVSFPGKPGRVLLRAMLRPLLHMLLSVRQCGAGFFSNTATDSHWHDISLWRFWISFWQYSKSLYGQSGGRF